MPKVTLNKPVTVDKKKDKPCSQQCMVSRLRRRYVRTVKIGDKWNTYLQIDHQGFCVVEQTCHHRARWFGKNLAIALERMLAANHVAAPIEKRIKSPLDA
jgi:predicted ATPase